MVHFGRGTLRARAAQDRRLIARYGPIFRALRRSPALETGKIAREK
jgi:hypothetical protein